MAIRSEIEALRQEQVNKLARLIQIIDENDGGVSPLEMAEALYRRLEIQYKDDHGRFIAVTDRANEEPNGADDESGRDSTASGDS